MGGRVQGHKGGLVGKGAQLSQIAGQCREGAKGALSNCELLRGKWEQIPDGEGTFELDQILASKE